MLTNAATVTGTKPAAICVGNVLYKIKIITKKTKPSLYAEVFGEVI